MRRKQQITLLREALRLTREYVSEPMLPALSGWTWFDAAIATGGLEGFGGCGCALDPKTWGHAPTTVGLRYCGLPAGHGGEHAPHPESGDTEP